MHSFLLCYLICTLRISIHCIKLVRKILLEVYVSCCLSARQRIHMKNQALFSSKDKSNKKLKCRLLQFLFGTLRVKQMENLNTGTDRLEHMV